MSDLPQPTDGFGWVQGAVGPMLVCRPLSAFAPHFFTSRSWPLGTSTAGRDEGEAWQSVAETIGVGSNRLARLRQVHGAAWVRVEDAAGADPPPPADIVVSCDPARAAAVQAADCVPLLLADVRTGAVAAAHAGWRGLAARVPMQAAAALARAFGSRADDLVAAVGPAIGACCYEVGDEVREHFAAAGFDRGALTRWFLERPSATARNPSMARLNGATRPGRWFLDVWLAVRDQLISAGVKPTDIHVAELCTASHPAALCSYRRDGAGAGRIAGAIRSTPRP